MTKAEKYHLLHSLAEKYETQEFLKDDPSYFMHQVIGKENQETMAFIAACLSYGSRKQFFPKIQFILDKSNKEPYNWIKNGEYKEHFPNDKSCFYRLYSNAMMLQFFTALEALFKEFYSLENFIRTTSVDTLTAIDSICTYFSQQNVVGIIPKNAHSACKRLCMFLRWMVRNESPVDLGVWEHFIDKRNLIMPLDTHVMQQAQKLGLISTNTANMKTAIELTKQMRKVFPNDPLRGDFALFGHGVNNKL